MSSDLYNRFTLKIPTPRGPGPNLLRAHHAHALVVKAHVLGGALARERYEKVENSAIREELVQVSERLGSIYQEVIFEGDVLNMVERIQHDQSEEHGSSISYDPPLWRTKKVCKRLHSG